jgi:F420-dependent oxidoreductase-like protein
VWSQAGIRTIGCRGAESTQSRPDPEGAQMRIGMSIARFDWPGQPHSIGPDLAAIVKAADQAGLHSLWAMDHFWQIPFNGPPEEPLLESYTMLSYFAGITSQVNLGALVTGVSYRHPGVLVKSITSLDVLSGGRAWLGIGAAWYAEEARGLGIPFPPLRERYGQLEETLQIAHHMWAGDESAFDGSHYRLERPLNSPGAIRSPHPPILIGGAGERRTLRLVARYADACNFFEPLGAAEIGRKLDVLRGHCEAVGRPYDDIAKTIVALIDDGEVEEWTDRLGRLADLGVDLVIVELPGKDAGAVDKVAKLAAAVQPLGRPTPSVLG